METLYQILAIIGAGLILWWLYKTIKNRPEQFSKDKLTKSFSTLGILGLLLIVFVALLILFVRNS